MFMEKLVTYMKNILVQEGGLEGVGTGFVVTKIKIEGLIILEVLKGNKFLMIESKYIGI